MHLQWDGKSEQSWDMTIENQHVALWIMSTQRMINLGLSRNNSDVSPMVVDGNVFLPLEWFQSYGKDNMRFIFNSKN